MKFLKRARAIDVKRAFLLTFFLRDEGVAGQHQSTPATAREYVAALKEAKTALMKLSEPKLDRLVAKHTVKRLAAYKRVKWYIGNVSTREVGVWKGAGGLPAAWTHGSLVDTAKRVRTGLRTRDPKINRRAKRAIPAIISLRAIIKKETLQLPIIFEAGAGTGARKGLRRMRGEIDDGNMRSIAYAVSGDKKIKAYIGRVSK